MNQVAATIPGTEEHKLAQRERILAAAQECFIRSGFHSASMATIAETAGISPGLIYRYFENKNAIILAIIEKQLTIAQGRIREMRTTSDLCGGILDYFNAHDTEEHGMSTALFLEIAVEATRDPEIGQAVGRFDQAVRAEMADWLQRPVSEGGYGLDAATARDRALSLMLVIEGLKVRKAREPVLDCTLLKRSLAVLLTALDREAAG
jgi:AcrR family transcriptional regulator